MKNRQFNKNVLDFPKPSANPVKYNFTKRNVVIGAKMSQLPQIIHKQGPDMESNTPYIPPDMEECVGF